jgi:hypothetical protein
VLRLLLILAFVSPAWAQYPSPYRKLSPPAGTLALDSTVLACENQTAPATPPQGQILYCKAGAGWCAKDSSGTERCTGSGGGGGYTPPWLLSDLEDDAVADKCLRSGGAGGNPAWEACQPEIVVTDAPYLADATGVADATAAIIAAMAAAGSAPIRFPVGTYKVTPGTTIGGRQIAFTIRSDLHLVGDKGAVLKIKDSVSTNGSPVHFAMFSTPTTGSFSNVSFQGLTFDGNGANNLTNGAAYNQAFVHVNNSAKIDDVLIEDCTFKNNAGQNNIIMGGGTSAALGKRWTVRNTLHLDNAIDAPDFTAIYAWADDVAVENNRFIQTTAPTVFNGKNARNAIELHGSNSSAVENYTRNYVNGVYIYPNKTSNQVNVQVAHNTFDQAYLGGVRLARDGATEFPSSHIAITDNQVVLTNTAYSTVATYKHGVLIDSEYAVDDVLIARNQVYAPATMLNVSAAVNIVGGVTASGGEHTRLRILANSGYGTYHVVRVLATTGIDGVGSVEIVGNAAWNLSNASTSTTPIGIFVRGQSAIDRAVIDDNEIADDRGGSSETDYGIWVQDTVTAFVRSNRMLGVGTPYTWSGGPTYTISDPDPGLTFATLGTPQDGSWAYCDNCTFDATTGVCNTGGAGTAKRIAKRLFGTWCCAEGKGFSTCGSAILDADVPDTITASNYLPLGGGTMTGNLALAASGVAMSGGGLVDCDTEAQVLGWDSATQRFVCTADAGAGGGMTSFNVADDAANTLTITDAETLKIAGGADLTTTRTAGSPEVLTIDLDNTLTGRSGGRTFNGGTAASELLSLQSTSNATKGEVRVGAETLNLQGSSGAATAPVLGLYEAAANGSDYVGLRAPASVASPWVLTLPGTGGTNLYFLQTNGSGTTTWASALTAEVDGSTTNELQNIFETVATSSGTSPVADTTTDTLTINGTAPLSVTGSSSTDTITVACTTASAGVAGCLNSTDWSTFNSKLSAEVDGSTTNEIEVVDEAYSAANFNAGTTTAVSQDDLYDLIHAGDADDDGKPDILDTTSNGFVKTTGGTGAISIDTNTYLTAEVDGSTTNELQNIFQTFDASSGTDPVADTTTDTLIVTGTAPITVTGDAAADSLTIALGDVALTTNTSGNYVATVTGGAGIASTGATSGEGIAHTLSTASGETDFLASGALTCTTAQQGRMQVHTTPLQYCDNAATPTLRYAAYGNNAGESTAAATNSVDLTTDTVGNYVSAATASQGLTVSTPEGGTVGLIDCAENQILKNTGTGGTAWTCAADDTGGGSYTFTLDGDDATTQAIDNTDTLLIAGGNGITTDVTATDTITIDLDGALRITNTAGVDCTGATDSSTGITNAITAAVAANKALVIPSGCVLGLASPGAGNAAVSVAAGAVIVCEDATAGFRAEQQRCVGGTYPGAACNTSTECTGGGTCTPDLGGSSANPCTGTECFAPTNGSTYTMLKDAGNGTGITMLNCSFWAGQADPYQRCTGAGTFAGRPCRQECSSGTFAGFRCEATATCSGLGSGTCLRIEDCADGGGGSTCAGAPNPATGLGGIVPLDLNRTTSTRIQNVAIKDHFEGPSSIIVAANALLIDTTTAADVNNCTTPIPATPATSGCLGAQAGICCYGAAGGLSGANAQPANQVTEGIDAAYGANLTRVKARGLTYAIDGEFSSGLNGPTISNSDVLPSSANGPGQASAGIRAAGGQVLDSRILYPKASGTSIETTASALIRGNTLLGLNGSGAVGIASKASTTTIANNRIEGAAGTAIAVGVNGGQAGQNIVQGNSITSNAVDLLESGVVIYGHDTIVDTNIFSRLKTASVRVNEGWGTRIVNNVSKLGTCGGGQPGVAGCNAAATLGSYVTPTFMPRHFIVAGGAFATSQTTIANNEMTAGWRGIDSDDGTNGLTNINIANNRGYSISGAFGAVGGAGVQYVGNYVNGGQNAYGGGAGPVTVCDPSCSVTPGFPCNADADCGTCGSTYKCVPEPTIWVGSPNNSSVRSTSHMGMLGNILYAGSQFGGQCTGSGNIGQLCDTAVTACAGGASCSGTPAVCQTGTEKGKRCCTTGTCTQPRQSWSDVRMTDGSHVEMNIAANQIFGLQTANMKWIDMSSGVAGDPDLAGGAITGNQIYGNTGAPTSTTSLGIAFPAGTPTITNVAVAGNHFWQINDKIVNWKGTWGLASLLPKSQGLRADMTTNSTSFTNVTDGTTPVSIALDANSAYYFNCEATFRSSVVTTGIAFAVTGPTSPTNFSYINRLPTISVETGAGTDTMTEQEGHADDGTAAASIGVGSTSIDYTAAVRGNILVGATAGNLTLRVKAENANNVTIRKGTNCVVTEIPL